MKLQNALLIALFLASCAACDATATEPVSKTIIVFIMADDLGYTDVACFGSKYYNRSDVMGFDRVAFLGTRTDHW